MQRSVVILFVLLLCGGLARAIPAESLAAQVSPPAVAVPAEPALAGPVDEPEPLGPIALKLQPACEAGANRRAASAALVLALREKRWIIRGADLEGGQVSARACSLRSCVTIDAAVDAQGLIDISATRRLRGEEVVTDLPRNWERHLTHAYEGFSCYPANQLFDLYDQHRYPRSSSSDLDQ